MRTRSQTTSVTNVQLVLSETNLSETNKPTFSKRTTTEMVAADALLTLRRSSRNSVPIQNVFTPIPSSSHRMTTRSMAKNVTPQNLSVYMDDEVDAHGSDSDVSSDSSTTMVTRSRMRTRG
jgi:hypothetical protein